MNGMEKSSNVKPLDLIWYEHSGTYTEDEMGRLTAINLCGLGYHDEHPEILALFERDLSKLQSLNLSENKLREIKIPDSASRLVHLNVSENPALRSFQLQGAYPDLETLDASECKLEKFELPEGCKRLRILDLHKNELESIAFNSNCPELENLNLANNKLRELSLPFDFENLSYLYLPDNQLEQLNINTVSLPALSTLHLRNNQLKALPENVILNKKFLSLYLHNNPLPDIPNEIIHNDERGNSFEAIRDYLRESGKGTLINDRVKIIIVGNGRVGKTSMFRRLRDEPFNPLEPYTHGVQLGTLEKSNVPEVKTDQLQANVWDFGGQEIFYATHQFFLSDDALYLLAWTDEQNVLGHRERDREILPFDEKWHSTDYWLENIRLRSKDSPIVMVQTHCDEIRSKVKSEYQQAPYHASVVNFSALKDLGLSDLRYLLAEKLNKGIRNFGQDFPRTYDRVITLIEARKQSTPTISRDEFISICRSASITEGGEDSLLFYLHRTGVVVYFGESELSKSESKDDSGVSLKNTVYIDPNWLTRQVYRLINNELGELKGKIDHSYLRKTLPDYSSEEIERFIKLLQQFELIFQESEGVYIAPHYLPDSLSGDAKVLFDSIFEGLKEAFVFRFSRFVPDNVMINFLSRYGPYSNKIYWKDGIYFSSKEGVKCIVTFNPKEKKLSVYTEKNDKSLIIQREILDAFIELSRNANAEISVSGNPFVSWQELQKAMELKNPRLFAMDGKTSLELTDFGFLKPSEPEPTTKKIFFSYSKHDRVYLEQLQRHLSVLQREGRLQYWDDHHILPGEDWDTAIKEELARADIILLLVSDYFLATDYIWKEEIARAMVRHEKGEARVIPIILRPCYWESTSFAKLNGLPSKAKPVSDYQSRDRAWLEVVKGIERILN